MRLLLPASRLATARKLAPDAEFAALNEALGLGPVSEQQLYDTLDWLARRQPAIEAKLARRGYSRDGKRGSRQILVGLLCDAAGRPVSAEVCAGNTATVPAQVDKLRRRFGLSRVVLVGDRGMLTAARIREDLAPHEELGWISALRAPAIRRLLRERRFRSRAGRGLAAGADREPGLPPGVATKWWTLEGAAEGSNSVEGGTMMA